MKLSLTDDGSGIMLKFAQALGATVQGRSVYIPENIGGGYMTGLSWGPDLRMMIRNYHLKEDILIERTNELANLHDDVIFLLSGVFPSPVHPEKQMSMEQPNVRIFAHAFSSVMTMPSHTIFGSVTMAVSRQHLRQLFGKIDHPIVKTVLEAKDNFLFETGVSSEIIKTATEMLHQPVPESLESHYFKIKCEELLCYIFALLLQRDAVPASSIHIDDVKAIYGIKLFLQSHLDTPPDIATLAKNAHMSEPKLRKIFRQTFGKGVFEYYQSARMQEAARLLLEKRLTVSDAGYQLGFTNLSHFSRVFEQYIGMKPKKFSVSGKL
jgi:AraC-like DNA-binding protein